MEIKKGYTLSQFVDKIFGKESNCAVTEINKLRKYNDFLKQPLKEDMFFNNYERPDICDLYKDGYSSRLLKWEEAEQKIIFNAVKIPYNRVLLSNYCIAEINYKNKWLFRCKTLGELFEATSSELELKNVNIS